MGGGHSLAREAEIALEMTKARRTASEAMGIYCGQVH